MRLLLDEHYSPAIAAQLRALGHDVLSVAEAGLVGADDERLLRWAEADRRALLTNNVRDFVLLAREWAGSGERHHGLLFTSDAALPRGRNTIGRFVAVLADLLQVNPSTDALRDELRWLA